MINCLIIGTQKSVETYKQNVSNLTFFSKTETLILDTKTSIIPYVDFKKYDALIFADCNKNIKSIIETAIKLQCNIYFTDQRWVNSEITSEWLKYQNEANCLFFCEIPELKNTLSEDFLQTYNRTLLVKYQKNIESGSHVRSALLNALAFINLMNAMQVKKVDINSMDTTPNGKPVIKIRLKMYDNSIGFISLKQTTKTEHSLEIQTRNEKFFFNFSDSYLENSHGIKFTSAPTMQNDLIIKSIEAFALNIIQNNQPSFTLFHYNAVLSIIDKIENILSENF
ncbi:MAG: hypothetical protein PF436_00270 [Prolixibacteraceae bacterium]|jgi:hypothetical protein|nr:hypothetical protein [Prolixibacteraceae bacterium]